MKENPTAKRIERFFKIASLLCADCDHFIKIYDEDGNVTETIEDYGIYTKDEWEKEMNKEISWLRQNRNEVLSLLPELQKEWSASCDSVRLILTGASFN